MGNSPAWNPDPSTLKPVQAAPSNAWNPDPSTLKPLPTERAMQQGIGGPPMFVDVPQGQKQAFEQAGQKGYQTGAAIGAGAVTGAALGGTIAATPEAAATANFLINLVKAHPIASTWVAGHLANALGVPLPKVAKAILGIREIVPGAAE